MANSIVSNAAANTALRYLQTNSGAASSSVAKLSSGSRIVKASDDAASLAVGTKLKADVTALKQAQVNAGQATSLLQVADGGMARIADILQRMKALAVQASSGSVTNTERTFLNEEFTALRSQVNSIAAETKFNGQTLIDGSLGTSTTLGAGWATTGAGSRGISVRVTGSVGAASVTYEISFDNDKTKGIGTFTLTEKTAGNKVYSASLTTATTGTDVLDKTVEFKDAGIALDLSNFVAIQAGTDFDMAGSAATQFTVTQNGTLDFQVGVLATEKISVSLNDVDATALGIASSTIDTQANANTASTALDTAIQRVNQARASVGALMSRFDAVATNLATGIENIEAARSTLMDVDVAAEMAKFTSAQVLMQANVAMLAQANQMPQNLLRLMQ